MSPPSFTLYDFNSRLLMNQKFLWFFVYIYFGNKCYKWARIRLLWARFKRISNELIITVLLIKLNQSFKVYKNKLRMIETIKINIDADAKGAKDEMKTSWILETGLLLLASSIAFIATLYFVLTLNMSLLKKETKCIDIEHRVLYVMVKFSSSFKNNICKYSQRHQIFGENLL